MRSKDGISRQGALHLSAAVLALGATAHCAAATLTVSVADNRGEPVAQVAVYAMPKDRPPVAASTEFGPAQPTAIMDQANNAFLPHLLIVQAGTEVLFPNNDVVSHHVYSFSEAKTFELGLYKGDAYPPVQFDTPGVVVIGCNIHDGMLGYIVVVDTPYFALTDGTGTVRFDGLAIGDYTLEIWTPRARPSSLPPAGTISVGAAENELVAFELRGKLSPDHDHRHASLSWERY